MKSKDSVEEDCHEANAAKSPSFTATKLGHPQMLMFEHSETLTKWRHVSHTKQMALQRETPCIKQHNTICRVYYT